MMLWGSFTFIANVSGTIASQFVKQRDETKMTKQQRIHGETLCVLILKAFSTFSSDAIILS